MIPYKGYLIWGETVRVHPKATPTWYRSQGTVFTNNPTGSIKIKQLEGVIFESKEAAEAHGLELCKEWVDDNLGMSDDV